MKNFIFFFAFIVSSMAGNSQYRLGAFGGISFFPSTGPDRLMLGSKGSSFDKFVANYNALNAADLSSPLTHFKMRPSFYAGLNFFTKSYYSEFAYNTLHGKAEATFVNGNKRVLEMKSGDFDIGIGFGYSTDKFYAYFVGIMNFGFGDRLDAYTEYPDGTISYGMENYLNGHYQTLRLGLRPALRIGYFVTPRVSLMFLLDKLKEGGDSDEYRDVLAGDITTESINADLEYIGVNWQEYINSPSDYVLADGEMVKGGWSGLQMRLGICFQINNPGYYED